MSRRPASARLALLVAAPLLLGLTACGGSSSGAQASVASPATSDASTSSAPAASTSSSPSETATPEETATPAAEITLADVPGYTVEAAPSQFDGISGAMMETGTVSAVKAVGLKGSDGELAAVFIAAQYTPEITKSFGNMPSSSILESVAAGVKPSLTGKVTQTKVKLDGTDAVVLSTKDLAVTLVYFDGGLLVQLYGPDRTALVAATKAFVAAQNG